MKPLEGVTVIELSSYFAVPGAGRMLASQGARVIKVEPPRGDIQRYFAMAFNVPCKPDENPLFDTINGGKEFVSLDLKDPADMEKLHKMIAQADVFLTNNRTKALQKMGLDYDSLKDKYPRLVMATLSGYGEKGALKDAPGFDLVAMFQETGFSRDLMVATDHTTYPANSAYGFGDIAAGSILAGAVGMALYRREKTGKGDHVTSSLYGTGVWLTSVLTQLSQFGYPYPLDRGFSAPTGIPYQTRDGEWIGITINEPERYWEPLCRALGSDKLLSNPDYGNRNKWVTSYELCSETIKLLEEAFMQHDCDEILEKLRAADIVCTKLVHFKANVTNPQALENSFVAPITYPNGDTTALGQPPVRFTDMDDPKAEQGKAVGADNAKVFADFGIA
ncbi:CaiB/BaiF CoA transferase family protein [Enteroscipio rubneri]|uniref:CoA transferase n=1 Tax=Enteroscipio rubneri TaxID=2070686 RepID=A0A2K2UBQ8_9ACTN|nr:CoA transferase [Enteroscipio rubneri]PNV67714.1 CoA transferase [Enteroscipio rubneri]